MSAEYVSHETQSLEAVHRILLDLKLRFIDREEIKVRKAPWTTHTIFKGITVWNVGNKYAAGTNEREDVGYGCGVTMCITKSDDVTDKIDRLAFWEGIIRREFVNRMRLEIENMLKGCSGGEVVVGEHNPKPSRNHPEIDNYEHKSLVIWAWFREARGTTA